MATDKTKITVSRWVRNGIIDHEDKEDVYAKLIEYDYINLSKAQKESISLCFKAGLVDSDTTIEDIELMSFDIRRARARRALETRIDRYGEEGLKAIYDNRDTIGGRIAAFRQKYPEMKHLSDDECKRLSYYYGIVEKGRKVCEEIGLDLDDMTEEEICSMSGLAKTTNHTLLSEAEKEEKRLQWKRSCLSNPSAVSFVSKDYPEFESVDITNLCDDDINHWYSTYVSLRSARSIQRRLLNRPNYVTGVFKSLKSSTNNYYRSSYEKRALTMLETIDDVVYYESEPFHIKMKDEEGRHLFSYVPDIIVRFRDGNWVLVEVKPGYRVQYFLDMKGARIKEKYRDQFVIVTEDDLENKGAFYAAISTYRNNQ